MDWRGGLAGAATGIAALVVAALLPGVERAGITALVVVLGAGPVAGVTAGLVSLGRAAPSHRAAGATGGSAPDVRAAAGRQGLLAGAAAGAFFAASFRAALSAPGPTTGAYAGLNYLLATGGGSVPVVRTHGAAVVSAVAVGGGLAIAGLGWFSGRRAVVRARELRAERE